MRFPASRGVWAVTAVYAGWLPPLHKGTDYRRTTNESKVLWMAPNRTMKSC